ncbi:Receptor-like protein kinase [Quillaja saponaria]|uniref:Receptor-like protein kinase n=1 Tax=Quillaja saponaria TaxID=32244 RepID=A0AAD7LAA7_QUISA|nr:Receptor-like protein kinase [Quillaja saponaria]
MLMLSAEEENGYQRHCRSFHCGKLDDLQFPFTSSDRPDCGLSVIYGCENPDPNATKEIQFVEDGRKFTVEKVDQDNSVWVHDYDLQHKLNSCQVFKYNLTLPSSSLLSPYIKHNVTLFSCNRTLNINAPGPEYVKYTSCHDYDVYFSSKFDSPSSLAELPSYFAQCSHFLLPFKYQSNSNDPFTFLTSEFPVEVKTSAECSKCYHKRRGHCKLDKKQEFYCGIDLKTQNTLNSSSADNNRTLKLGLGLGLGFGLPIIVMLIFWRYKSTHPSSDIQSRNTYHPNSNSDLETGSAIFGVPVFSYTELEEATNNFNHNKELGDGGFGVVYHGKLRDGREVAVKRLYEHNYRRVERFMNEVEILTRLSHQNWEMEALELYIMAIASSLSPVQVGQTAEFW